MSSRTEPGGSRPPNRGRAGCDCSQTVRIVLSPDGHAGTHPVQPEAGRGAGGSPFDDAAYGRVFPDCLYDAVLIADSGGRIVDANPRAGEFLQYAQPELSGLHFSDIVAGDVDAAVGSMQDALRQGQFVMIQGHCIRRDRSLFPAEMVLRGLPVTPSRLCLLVRDVTRRKNTEDRLRAGYTAMQNAASGIAILDIRGRFQYANPALLRLWDFPGDTDLPGRPFAELAAPDQPVDEMIESVTGRARPWDAEMLARKASGETFRVRVSASANRNEDGDVDGMVLSIVDVTAARRAETALRESARQQAMLASLVAACHHLAQPATVLLGNADAIRRSIPPGLEDLRKLAEASRAAAESLGEILHRLNRTIRYKTVSYLCDPHDPASAGSPANVMLDI